MGREDDWAVIAVWAATTLGMILLGSHIVSRPIAYLLGPIIVFPILLVVRHSAMRRKLFWALTLSASIGGFLWANYLFP
jgi:hypothetical protein